MKCLAFLALLTVVRCAVVEVDKCNWGESYLCSSLKVAQQCGAFQHCMVTVWKNQEPKPVTDDTDICQFCEGLVTEVRKFIEDKKDQETIKKYLEAACAIIPDQAMANECKDMVENYVDVVLELITSELMPKTVCSLMGLCNGSAFEDTAKHPAAPHQPIQNPRGVDAEPICTDCKKLFTDLNQMITSSHIEKEIEQMIEQNLCSRLGSLQDYCNQMVEAYIPEILDLLMSEVDLAEMCAAMGFCNSSQAASTLLTRLRLQQSPLFASTKKLKSAETCTLCKTVFNDLQRLKKDIKLKTEVETFLKNNLCRHLGDMKGTCDQTIDGYLPVLFEMLTTELDAETVCQSLGLCDSSINHTMRTSMPKEPQPRKSVEASAECVLCEFIVKELDGELSQNATRHEIINALTTTCNALPDNLKQKCKYFVSNYVPTILAILEEDMKPPQVVCTFFGLCKSSKQQQFLIAKPKVGDGEICSACKNLIQYIEISLETNSTVQKIDHILEKVCNFIKESERAECQDIVKAFGLGILQLIAQLADPQKVCTWLGLCKTKAMPQVIPMTKLVDSKATTATWRPREYVGPKPLV